MRFRTGFYGKLGVLSLYEIYNGVTHQPTLRRLLLLGTAYLIFVGYSAGIYDVIIAIRLIDQCPNCSIENTVKLPDGDCEVVRGSSGDIPSSGAFTCEGVDHWSKPDRGEGCGAEFSINVDYDAYGDSNSL